MFFAKISDEIMEKTPVSEFGGPVVGRKEKMRTAFLINASEALIGVEDFLPGSEVNWSFYHSELHLVLKGKAEITYTLPPNYQKMKCRTVEKGDTYIIIQGARIRWKVLGEEPYRHYFAIMPRYHYEKYLLKEDY